MMAAPRRTREDVLAERRAQYGASVLADASAKVRGSPWQGGATLYSASRAAFELVAGGVLEEGDVIAELTAAGLAAGGFKDAIAGALRRARAKGFESPRGLPEDDGARRRPVIAPAMASPVILSGKETEEAPAIDAAVMARAAVMALGVANPADWPAELRGWCESVGIPADELIPLGVRWIPSAKVRALGEEVGALAGLFSVDRGQWLPMASGRNAEGLWFPSWAPCGSELVPDGWAWRPSMPVVIGGDEHKMMRTAKSPGAGWWPFGVRRRGFDVLAIVEGEKDWAVMARPGCIAGFDVIGLPGAQWHSTWAGLLAGRTRVIVALDADAAGEDAAAKVIEAARAAGVAEVWRVLPPGGLNDWADAIAAGWDRRELVATWRPLSKALGSSWNEWPLVQWLGGPGVADDAALIGCRVIGPGAREVLRRMAREDRAGLVAAGWLDALGAPWGPAARDAAAGLLVPVHRPEGGAAVGWHCVGPAWGPDGCGMAGGLAWPIGWSWADAVAISPLAKAPAVLVRSVLDVVKYAGLAWGLPGDDDTASFDVLALGDEWRPEWATVLEGRPAVIVAAPGPDWAAGGKAWRALRGLKVPAAVTPLGDGPGRLSAGDIVKAWRARLAEVMR